MSPSRTIKKYAKHVEMALFNKTGGDPITATQVLEKLITITDQNLTVDTTCFSKKTGESICNCIQHFLKLLSEQHCTTKPKQLQQIVDGLATVIQLGHTDDEQPLQKICQRNLLFYSC